MHKNRNIIIRYISLSISILLALVGIIILRQGEILSGILITIVAAILFVILTKYNEKNPLSGDDALVYQPIIMPSLFWIASISIMTFVLSYMSNWDRSGTINRWIAFGWVISLLCAAVGMLLAIKWHPNWKQLGERIKNNRIELLIVASLLIVGFFLRIFILNDHPFPWSGDEASVGIEGQRIISGEVTDFFASGWSGQPNWSFVPTTLSLMILGKGIIAVRFVSALEGTLAILGLYLLSRELFGRNVATLAAGFLVAFAYHLQFSRIGVNNIIDSMTVCFVLWLTSRAIRRGNIADYFWAGMAGGLSFYTYVGSRLVLLLAIIMIIYSIFFRRDSIKTQLVFMGSFLAAAILAMTPLLYYFIRHPDIFMTRFGQESIFLNHWLTNEAARTGTSIARILLKQFADTILVYISQPAVGNFFNSSQPYLSILGSIFFVFGMVYAFMKLKEPRMVTLLVWFWAVVFLGGVLTLSPPANTRLIMTSPAVAIFIALGITQFFRILTQLNLLNLRWQAIFSVSLLVILGMQNIAYYFGIYRYENYFQDATGEYAEVFGLELEKLGPNYDYYLFGLPRIFAAFPTIVFLSPENNMYDINRDMIDSLVLNPGKSNIFVAIPENRIDLERIKEIYPGGTWEEVGRRYRLEVLYYAYILP
jgi:4-amino-4-deoxy-L-arabinose transferase-like glycosyltransferase